MLDFVIRGALVVDGSGAPAIQTDVGVKDGKIGGVGSDLGPARETIDASGLVLMPGIIDGHTHYDAQLTWDPLADPSLPMGVTTVVIGNCGFTIAPCRPEDRDLTMRNLTHVEGMSLEALTTGIRWDFESFDEYLSLLERQGVGPNVAAFIGHSSLRTYVLGKDASKRVATDEELERMCEIVRECMKAGAVGFATSTNEPHNGEGGVPMPSRLADDREMSALIRAMGEGGKGLYMLTRGSKTTIPFLESLERESDRPVLVAALFYDESNPRKVFDLVDQINEARSRGSRLYGQVSCCPLTMDFTLESPYVFESIDGWRPAMEASPEGARKLFADRGFRETVKADMARQAGRALFHNQWDRVQVGQVARPEFRYLEGQTVKALAEAKGVEPLDWLLDFSLEEDLKTLFTAQLRNIDNEPVGQLIADPDTHVALSDAGAHLTFLCDAAYGLHLLGNWVRDLKVLSLEEAVRKLTGQPAEIFGIADRGLLRPGLAADLLLVDPDTVSRLPNVRQDDLPAGATRLVGRGTGVKGVWVNGQRVVTDDALHPAPVSLSGKVLRDFKDLAPHPEAQAVSAA